MGNLSAIPLMIRARRQSFVFALIAWSLAIICYRPASGAEVQPFLTGQLLVAAEEMKDPRFIESVIYMVNHDSDGALGLVINRPMAKGPLDDLLKGFGVELENVKSEIIIHFGGPVAMRQGFMLHSDDVVIDNSKKVGDGIAITSDVKLLEAVAQGKGPRQILFMLGYAGWGPGQLEGELKADPWFVVPGDKSLVFGKDAEKKWHQALDRRRIAL